MLTIIKILTNHFFVTFCVRVAAFHDKYFIFSNMIKVGFSKPTFIKQRLTWKHFSIMYNNLIFSKIMMVKLIGGNSATCSSSP